MNSLMLISAIDTQSESPLARGSGEHTQNTPTVPLCSFEQLTALPDELWLLIWRNLPLIDLFSLSQVSRSWRDLATSNSSLWNGVSYSDDPRAPILKRSPRATIMALQRGQESLIQVNAMHAHERHTYDLVKTMRDSGLQSERVSALDLDSYRYWAIRALMRDVGPFPNLDRVHISARCPWISGDVHILASIAASRSGGPRFLEFSLGCDWPGEAPLNVFARDAAFVNVRSLKGLAVYEVEQLDSLFEWMANLRELAMQISEIQTPLSKEARDTLGSMEKLSIVLIDVDPEKVLPDYTGGISYLHVTFVSADSDEVNFRRVLTTFADLSDGTLARLDLGRRHLKVLQHAWGEIDATSDPQHIRLSTISSPMRSRELAFGVVTKHRTHIPASDPLSSGDFMIRAPGPMGRTITIDDLQSIAFESLLTQFNMVSPNLPCIWATASNLNALLKALPASMRARITRMSVELDGESRPRGNPSETAYATGLASLRELVVTSEHGVEKVEVEASAVLQLVKFLAGFEEHSSRLLKILDIRVVVGRQWTQADLDELRNLAEHVYL